MNKRTQELVERARDLYGSKERKFQVNSSRDVIFSRERAETLNATISSGTRKAQIKFSCERAIRGNRRAIEDLANR